MPRTQLNLWLFFLGVMAGLGLMWFAFRIHSGWLTAGSVLWIGLLGIMGQFMTCPGCGERLPRYSREALDLFNPQWKCANCGRDL